MAEQYVKKIRTDKGDLSIDYEALAHLPVSDKELVTDGAFADGKIVGEKFTQSSQIIENLKSNLEQVKAISDQNKIDISGINSTISNLTTNVNNIEKNISNIETNINEIEVNVASLETDVSNNSDKININKNNISENLIKINKNTEDINNVKAIANESVSYSKAQSLNSQQKIQARENIGAMDASLKGVNNGVAELDDTGRVKSSQLPSYVDDVINGYLYQNEFYEDKNHSKKIVPESSKIYIELDSNKTYRWTGSIYTEISQSLALGETESSAYRGDRGKESYDHSKLTSGNPHGVTKIDVGLGNVENKSSEVIRSEITKKNVTDALGYTPPINGTIYNLETAPSHQANAALINLIGDDGSSSNIEIKGSGLTTIKIDNEGDVVVNTDVDLEKQITRVPNLPVINEEEYLKSKLFVQNGRLHYLDGLNTTTGSSLNVFKELEYSFELGTSAIVGDFLYLIGGHYNGFDSTKIYKVNLKDKTLIDTHVSIPLSELTFTENVVYKNNIYLIGGYRSKKIYKYDTILNKISTLNLELPVPTTGASYVNEITVVQYDNIVYLIGGSTQDRYGSSLFTKVDLEKETVEVMPNKFPINIWRGFTIKNGYKTYIMGGGDESNKYLDSVLIFDVRDESVKLAPFTLPIKLQGSSACVFGNIAYIFGGVKSNKIFKFNLESEEFQELDITIPTIYNSDNPSVNIYKGEAYLTSIGKDILRFFPNGELYTYRTVPTTADVATTDKVTQIEKKIDDHIAVKIGNPHNVTKEDLSLGNVENKSSETIRSEITKTNVTTALGYTPPTPETVNEVEIKIDNHIKDETNPHKVTAEQVDAYDKKQINNGLFEEVPVTMSGTAVSTDMVSPIEHEVGCNVSSKNLLNPDNSFHNQTQYSFGDPGRGNTPFLLKRGTYTISATGGICNQIAAKRPDGSYIKSVFNQNHATFTVNDDSLVFVFFYREASPFEISQMVLSRGTSIVPYTPYVSDLTAVTVSRYGWNLIDFFKAEKNSALNISDGKINPDKYGRAVTDFIPVNPDIPMYSNAWNYNSNSLCYYDINKEFITGVNHDSNQAVMIQLSPPKNARYIRQTVNPFKDDNVQITLSSKVHPKAGESGSEYLIPDEEGIVTGMTSISPEMIILTDNPNVTVEATYNADVSKYTANKSMTSEEMLAAEKLKFSKVDGKINSKVTESNTSKGLVLGQDEIGVYYMINEEV